MRFHRPLFTAGLVAGAALFVLAVATSARAEGPAGTAAPAGQDEGVQPQDLRTGRHVPIPLLAPRGGPASSFSAAGQSGAGPVLAPAPAPGPRIDTAPPSGKDGANLAYGAFQRGYYLTAMDIALPLAQDGNPAAQTLIAEIFARGLGVARSMDEAAFWYKEAAAGGDPSAQFRYALMLMEGTGVKKDPAQAQELMKKSADAGIPEAEFNYAQQLVAAEPGEAGLGKALPYFEKAAAAGIADAQYALSQIYANSASVPEDKRAKARYWLARAARAGYDTAQLDLGIWLIDGIGGKKDYENGFKWMKRAAETGNVMAQNRLAHLYHAGIGTPQDEIAAATWYVLSRRAGLSDNSLDDFFQGLSDDQQKEAIRRANASPAQ